MRVRWTSELNGRHGIVVDPEGYDGVPWLRELWMDRSPVAFHNDRLAVAAALVFGRYVASRLEFESPVSPGVSEAIKTFCGNPGLNISPIEYHQKLFPAGDGVLNIVSDHASTASHGVAEDRAVVLNVLRSDLYSGSLLGMTSLAVASNAFLHDADNDSIESCNLAELAVGVLFAEDLGLDSLRISDATPPELVSGMLTASGLRSA